MIKPLQVGNGKSGSRFITCLAVWFCVEQNIGRDCRLHGWRGSKSHPFGSHSSVKPEANDSSDCLQSTRLSVRTQPIFILERGVRFSHRVLSLIFKKSYQNGNFRNPIPWAYHPCSASGGDSTSQRPST